MNHINLDNRGIEVRKLKVIIVLVLCSAFLQACGSIKVQQPTIKETKNTRVIDKDFDTVWNSTMTYVADTFYVIDNVVKDSKLITLTFSNNDPNSLIDCGYIEKVGSSDTVAVATKNYRSGLCDYSSKLAGKVNIILTSLSENKTQVKVNVRYVFDWQQICPGAYNVPIIATKSFSFSTNEQASDQPITCTSRSKAEEDILNGIEKQTTSK